MNLERHSSLIVSMNRSQRPFKLGLALGNGLVRKPRDVKTFVNSLLNLASRSCMMISGFTSRPAVSSRNRSVCSTTQAEFGCSVDVETMTSREVMQSQTSTYISFRPRFVTVFTLKKSQAHNVSLWRSMKLFQVSEVRSGLGRIPSSFRIFRTVCRLIFLIPNFRNSPTIRVSPKFVTVAICNTSSLISRGLR